LIVILIREDYRYTLNDLKIKIKFNDDKIKRKNLHENIRQYFNFLESEASTQKNQNPLTAGKKSERNSNNNSKVKLLNLTFDLFNEYNSHIKHFSYIHLIIIDD